MSKQNITAGNGGDTDSIFTLSSAKALRADAKRNRDKLLDVAHRLFTAQGITVSMDEIARHAGVGVGTAYRHFPTKEELFGAVMVNYKARLVEEAKKWLRHGDPGEAFFSYFRIVIREAVANKAITDALVGSGLDKDPALKEVVGDFWSVLDKLLTRAQHNGSVRPDASVGDIRALLVGILQAHSESAPFPERIVSIICDGLRGKYPPG
ncbi:TetR/AcrR family transcriptional regulator [Paenibacillus sp. XY044]|uniref:TetR/AcrR family transcriptional regulator n=1 Tax=Paenibacillus sp. XY044 TaxID=2026089 RepID=UPI0015C64098|nr:TetR/AcrR family transcriptional regulator [Paenibacillus sp. XY044]